MQVLANENVPGPVVTALRAAGHDVLWVKESMTGAKDRDVLARAHSEVRLVVTFDKDFGELAFRGLAASVGVVLFRITLTAPDYAARAAVAAFTSRADWTRQFAVVEDDRIRLRALPSSTPDGDVI